MQGNFQPNLLPDTRCKQNVFQSLSQLTLTALFTKESLALWIVYVELRLQINTPKNPQPCLPISRRLVHMMDSEILLSSEPGKGSTFEFTLMLMPATPHEENTGGRGEDLQFPGVNVLVCEDNDLNAEIVQTILSDYKINVITAVNGLDATRKIRNLPRADSKTVPIVAMSANAFDEDKKRSLARGMNAHLSKPINVPMLEKILIKFIGKKGEETQKES